MRFLLPISCILIFAVSLQQALAGAGTEKVKHYKGEQPTSLTEARQLLSSYNVKLDALITKQQLTAEDVANIHQITYTLENSLLLMKNTLLSTAEKLEALHIASEKADVEKIKGMGQDYLKQMQQLLPAHKQ